MGHVFYILWLISFSPMRNRGDIRTVRFYKNFFQRNIFYNLVISADNLSFSWRESNNPGKRNIKSKPNIFFRLFQSTGKKMHHSTWRFNRQVENFQQVIMRIATVDNYRLICFFRQFQMLYKNLFLLLFKTFIGSSEIIQPALAYPTHL